MRNALASAIAALALLGCGPANPLQQIACLPNGDALMLVDDMVATAENTRLKAITAEPVRTTVPYVVDGRAHEGDLYLSGTPQAGMVLVPGASTAGKDDVRVVAMAKSLSRSRFAVLVPDLPNVKALRVQPSDARRLADALSYLAGRADLSPQGRVGIGAFSYALGPTMLATLEPDVRDKVRFVMGVGGYYDLPRVVTYFTTGYFREHAGGPWVFQKANDYGKWVFVKSNLDRFTDPTDVLTLTTMADRKLADPTADIADLSAALKSTEGKALFGLMTNTDPDKVPTLIGNLPATVRADMDALDLSKRDLSGVKARVILFHGYEDDLVPWPETPALAAALGGRARAYMISGLVHVDLKPPGFFDGWRMGCAVNDLLDERWRGP